ncbi:MAG TPA: lipid-A-disaccharide synthase N-terminal domain-containing protein, partial [Mesorhizobium sp.]
MTDVLTPLVTWLHQVFVQQFDGWVLLGFVAQAFFTMRFIVQWLASERAKRSVVPIAFWFFSLFGGGLLLIYAIQRR